LRVLAPDVDGVAWARLHHGDRFELDLRIRTERRLFWDGAYDGHLIGALVRLLPRGSTIIDVGANVGFYAIPLARALGARVFAFEPMAANVARLGRNVDANGLHRLVHVAPYALGAEPGSLRLAFERDIFGVSASSGNAAPAEPADAGIAVPVRTLDTAADELGIVDCALVKIDAEGAELGVLRGGAMFIARHKPLVLLELNAHWMRRAGWTAADLVELALGWHYDVARWNGRRFVPFSGPTEGIENVLLSPR